MYENRKIMTLAEMADYLRIAKRSLVRMARRGDIPATKVASQWRFMRSVVDDWLIARMKALPDHELETLIESEKLPLPLAALFRPELVRLDIEDLGMEKVLKLLVDLLVAADPRQDAGEFVGRLMAREEMVSTAIFPGIAIPHARKPEECPIPEPRIVVGVSRQGVNFNSLDGRPTHLFCLICANRVILHLKIIAQLALVFRRPRLAERIAAADTPQRVLEILLDN
jgi:PTS system nitrogen regulatory IIA component